jgi:hypothetical protein
VHTHGGLLLVTALIRHLLVRVEELLLVVAVRVDVVPILR